MSMSWEGLTAIGGFVLALLSVFGLIWKGGRLENQLETARALAEDLRLELKATRLEMKSEIDELAKQIQGLSRMTYEMAGASKRKRGDNEQS